MGTPFNLYLLVHLLSYAEIFSREAQSLNSDVLQEDIDLSNNSYQYDKLEYINALKNGGILTFFPTKRTFRIKKLIQDILSKESYDEVKCNKEWLHSINYIQKIDTRYTPSDKCVSLPSAPDKKEEKSSLQTLVIEKLSEFVSANTDNALFIFDTLYLLTYIFRTANYGYPDFKYLNRLRLFRPMISNLELQMEHRGEHRAEQRTKTNKENIHSKFLMKIRDLLILFLKERNDYTLKLDTVTSVESIDEIIAAFE